MTVGGYVGSHGKLHMIGALADVLYCKIRYCRGRTAGAYAKYYLGGTIYRNSGLKAYMERLFCLRDDEIHVAFAHRRLGLLPYQCGLRSRAAQAVQRVLVKVLPIKPNNNGSGPIQEVVRPREGFSVVYRAIADLLRQRGVNVRTGCMIKSVRKVANGFQVDTGAASGPEHFDHVVSTIPVPVMANLLGEPCQQTFEYVPLLSLFYRLRGELGGNATVLYNFTPDGNWKRITRFSSYYGQCDGEDYFTVEVAVRPGETLDVDRERAAFEQQARQLGICSTEPRYQGHVVTDRAYPIFRFSTYEQLQREKEKLLAKGIQLTGRQGDHDYVSTLEAAEGAWLAARKIVDAAGVA